MSNLKDVRQQGVTITLDKERHILFDLNAFAELEDAYGSVNDAMKALEKGSVKAIRKLLWAGLIHEDEALTERQVGRLVTLVDLESVAKEIGKAISVSTPDAEVEETKTVGEQK
jgi:hypothetical protein